MFSLCLNLFKQIGKTQVKRVDFRFPFPFHFSFYFSVYLFVILSEPAKSLPIFCLAFFQKSAKAPRWRKRKNYLKKNRKILIRASPQGYLRSVDY
jgi:hypothetical protein